MQAGSAFFSHKKPVAVPTRPSQRRGAAEKYAVKETGSRQHIPGTASHKLCAEKKATPLGPRVAAKYTGRPSCLGLRHLQTNRLTLPRPGWRGAEVQQGVRAGGLGRQGREEEPLDVTNIQTRLSAVSKTSEWC